MLRKKRSFYPLGALVMCVQVIFTFFITVGYSYAAGSNTPVYLGEATSSAISSLLSNETKQLDKISGQFTKKHIFKSTQSEVFVGKKKIGNAIETGGGVAQALAMAPGIQVTGYGGNSGLGKAVF